MRETLKEIVKAGWQKFSRWFNLSDVIFLAAAGGLGYGIWQIHPPTAWIVLGSLFLILTTYGRFK